MLIEFLIAMHFPEDIMTVDGFVTILNSTLVLIAMILFVCDLIRKHW
jgi:hypothetical protein